MAELKTNRVCGLITDFGNTDYFIGTMKGVMKKIDPGIEIIDISNDIPSYNIIAASFVIDKTYRFFPGSTIFLVVVDPGVGTTRSILLVRHGGQYFIAPDNGVLTPILNRRGTKVAVIDKKEYFLTHGFSTFEARDKMAPAAAFLTAGIDPAKLSSPAAEFILIPGYYPQRTKKYISARVAYIDKFGNIMTNVTQDFLFTALAESGKKHFKAEFKGKKIKDFFRTYALSGPEPFMLIGSHDNLEIAVNRGSAASLLQAQTGEDIRIFFY